MTALNPQIQADFNRQLTLCKNLLLLQAHNEIAHIPGQDYGGPGEWNKSYDPDSCRKALEKYKKFSDKYHECSFSFKNALEEDSSTYSPYPTKSGRWRIMEESGKKGKPEEEETPEDLPNGILNYKKKAEKYGKEALKHAEPLAVVLEKHVTCDLLRIIRDAEFIARQEDSNILPVKLKNEKTVAQTVLALREQHSLSAEAAESYIDSYLQALPYIDSAKEVVALELQEEVTKFKNTTKELFQYKITLPSNTPRKSR